MVKQMQKNLMIYLTSYKMEKMRQINTIKINKEKGEKND